MKHIYSKIIFVALIAFGLRATAQCTSCTTTITTTDPANYVVTSGMTLCISPSGNATGLITVGSGGILCNEGTINSTNLWIAGGTLNNYGAINTNKILTSGQGVLKNYGSIDMDSLLVTNIYSNLTNQGTITGIRMGNSDYSDIVNDGNITVDYMADSAAMFTNNPAGSFVINMDFANAYNSGYFNYGYFNVMRDFYNSTGSTFETACMGNVGRDWYNTAIISGPSGGCGGFNIAAGSYNTGTIGSAGTHVDLCDAGHPALGIDGPSGTIASTTTYCTCSNACVQIILGVATIESSDVFISSIYPNPSSTNVSIEISTNESETLVVEVYDMMGRKEMASLLKATFGINKLNLEVSKLSQGTYVLSITDSKKLQSKKMFSVVK